LIHDCKGLKADIYAESSDEDEVVEDSSSEGHGTGYSDDESLGPNDEQPNDQYRSEPETAIDELVQPESASNESVRNSGARPAGEPIQNLTRNRASREGCCCLQ
jgi:hypothetical protein